MEEERQIELLCMEVCDHYNSLEPGSKWVYEIHPDSTSKPYYITFDNRGSGLIYHRNFYRFQNGWSTPANNLSEVEKRLINYLNSI